MKWEIVFPVEPNTSYFVQADSAPLAEHLAYELARRMHRSEWFVRHGSKLWLHVLDTPPTVQHIWTSKNPQQ